MGVTTTAAFGCVKNTIRLRSGRYFDLADPQPDQFTLADIAGALSKLCRFGGQTPKFYSVAEHCLHCAELAYFDKRNQITMRTALLHDAAEAFIGDCVKPLKVMLPEYKAIEERIEAVIAAKYGLHNDDAWNAVSEIDHAMLIAERKELFGADGVTWTGENDVRVVRPLFRFFNFERAERTFLKVAKDLGTPETTS